MGVQRIARLGFVSALLLLPSAAWAQSSITGVVKDNSGGVLPGVTVEASSPALIEGSKPAVTDSQGLYRVVDLRPGPYAVTFTLYNLFNAATVLAMNTTYGNSWKDVTQILNGRQLRLAAQFDF